MYILICFYIFSELTVPTVVVLNTSNQQYFLLDRQIKNVEDMVQFINNILDGTVEVSFSLLFQRDDGLGQRRNQFISLLLILKRIVGHHPEQRAGPPYIASVQLQAEQSYILPDTEGSSMAEVAKRWKCPFRGYLEGIFGCHGDGEVLLAFKVEGQGCQEVCIVWGNLNSELACLLVCFQVQKYSWIKLLGLVF